MRARWGAPSTQPRCDPWSALSDLAEREGRAKVWAAAIDQVLSNPQKFQRCYAAVLALAGDRLLGKVPQAVIRADVPPAFLIAGPSGEVLAAPPRVVEAMGETVATGDGVEGEASVVQGEPIEADPVASTAERPSAG